MAASAAGLDLLQNLGLLIAGEVRPFRELVEQFGARLASVEQALNEKADHAKLDNRLQQIEQTLSEKASFNSVKQLTDQTTMLEQVLKSKADIDVNTRIAQMEQALHGMASINLMSELADRSKAFEQALNSKADINVHAQIAKMEKGLQDKADVSDLRHVQEQLTASGETLRTSVEEKSMQMVQLEDAITELLQQSTGSTERLQHMESTLSSVGQGLQRVDKVLLETPTTNRMQLLETAVAKVQVQVGQVEQVANEQLESAVAKVQAQVGQVQQVAKEKLETAVAKVQVQVEQIEQVAQEKASLSEISAQFTTMEKNIEKKVNLEQMQQFEEILGGVDGRVQRAERTLNEEKVGLDLMYQFEGLLKGIENRVECAEQTLNEEIGNGQIQQLEGSVMNFQMRVTHIEQALQQKADIMKVQLVEGSIACMEAQAKVLEEKADTTRVQQVEATINRVDAKMQSLVQASEEKCGKDALLGITDSVTRLESKLSSFNQIIQEKANANRLQEVDAVITSIRSRLSGMDQEMKDNHKLVLAQVNDPVMSLEAKLHSINQLLQGKVDSSTFHRMEDSLRSVELRCSGLAEAWQERVLEQTADTARATQVEASLASMDAKLRSCAQALHDKVEREALQGITDSVTCFESKLSSFSQIMEEKTNNKHLQEVEGRITSLHNTFGDLQQGIKGNADSVTCFESKLSRFSQIMEEKANTKHLQEVEGRITSLHNTFGNLQQGIKGNADSVTCFESKLSSFSQMIETKVNTKHLQEVEGRITSLHNMFSNLQQGIKDNQPATLEKATELSTSLEANLNSMSVMLQAKVDATTFQKIEDSVRSIDLRCNGLVEAWREKEKDGKSQVQRIEGALGGFVAKLTSVEEIMHEKVSFGQLQHQRLLLDGMQTKMSNMEVGVADCLAAARELAPQQTAAAERLERLESSTGAELTALKQALRGKANSEDMSRLRTSTEASPATGGVTSTASFQNNPGLRASTPPRGRGREAPSATRVNTSESGRSRSAASSSLRASWAYTADRAPWADTAHRQVTPRPQALTPPRKAIPAPPMPAPPLAIDGGATDSWHQEAVLEPPVTFTDEGYDAPISTHGTAAMPKLLARSRVAKRRISDA